MLPENMRKKLNRTEISIILLGSFLQNRGSIFQAYIFKEDFKIKLSGEHPYWFGNFKASV